MLLQECVYSYVLKIDGNVASRVRLVLTLWESKLQEQKESRITQAKHDDTILLDPSVSTLLGGWPCLYFLIFKFVFFFGFGSSCFLVHSAPFGPPT
jgi:hypothetical protein